jgi:excisionase family DNA binding protein
MSAQSTIEPLAHPVNTAAHLLSVSASQIWALIREEKIRAVRIGRRTLVPTKEIERLLQEGA